jgi:hypothetical protein
MKNTAMTEVEPGVQCYLVNLIEMKELLGCVVEVVRIVTVPDESGDWYQVRAGWLEDNFPGSDIHVRRGNLLPISAPDLAPPAARKRAVTISDTSSDVLKHNI